MAAMHEAFIRFAKMRRVLAFADLIGDDQAGVALRLQIPGVIEARRRSWRIGIDDLFTLRGIQRKWVSEDQVGIY